ncbi:ABC transporter substrate-binding protein [Cellulomonas sp. zg-ZUI199]|uniref:ABC transporter substrate-binding protein n=1 Tax=Cellulomonas wangleii TaxID=2816956 RepID=A0ABX8D2Y7_9CELL|nr:ABC transporter substrate-binding protein [Cellulomonas wangleii]MBO0923497.1 ABC transporter substrate-binding protein [Cellulomonas wangleii]QVI61839.1 ABC transporter substrate-binding protein [Cellulomonas wangleii]
MPLAPPGPVTGRTPAPPTARPVPARVRGRRLAALAAAALLPALLGACTGDAVADTPAATGAPSALPTAVPAGTTLVVGDPTTQEAVEIAGDDLDADLGFTIEWANLSGGPQTSEAFRAGALDVGAVADIPPIHAEWTGLDVKIVAAVYREDWEQNPIYEFGVGPDVDGVESLEDFAGHRIAYSPGQAQGVIVLRALEAAGLTTDDVTLVELPSNGDVYTTALAAGEVDIAPIGGVQIARYLKKYGVDGAHTVRHGLRDDPSHLYVPTSVLDDPAKAAALRAYVQLWTQAKLWVHDHPEEWKAGYYVKDQGLSPQDADYLVERAGVPDIPEDWTEHIARHQETVELLAAATGNEVLDAADLWDERFAPVVAQAAADYRAREAG